jgi:hypothetical protein
MHKESHFEGLDLDPLGHWAFSIVNRNQCHVVMIIRIGLVDAQRSNVDKDSSSYFPRKRGLTSRRCNHNLAKPTRIVETRQIGLVEWFFSIGQIERLFEVRLYILLQQ